MSQVTIVEKFNRTIAQMPIEQMFEQIRSGFYAKSVLPLRDLVKKGLMEEYAKLKRMLLAFTVCAWFDGGRTLEFIRGYNYLMVLDIDKQSGDVLLQIKARVCSCAFTFACFISPSGEGLKVIVRVSTEMKDHKKTFLSLQTFYQVLTEVDIDPSGKDVTRLCFVSVDPEIYVNPESQIYTPVEFQEEESDEINELGPVPRRGEKIISQDKEKSKKNPDMFAILTIYKKAIAEVKKVWKFSQGQRNNFVYALAVALHQAGLNEAMTEMLLLQDYNYNENEVKTSVKSAYKDNPIVKAGAKKQNPVVQDGTPNQNPEVQAEGETADGPEPEPEEETKTVHYRKPFFTIKKVEYYLSQWYNTRYNVVTGIMEWRFASTNMPFANLIDNDENTMWRYLQLAKQSIPISTLHTLLTSDYSPNFNPFEDYLTNLHWDGVTDYIGQLADTVKTTDKKYWDFCFRKWFVAYVGSMIDDDTINHTVIVLTGGQGLGKSTWIKRLVSPSLSQYLCPSIQGADSKDVSIFLTENILIMLDELENLNRRDLAVFKELITRPKVKIRRPYGRNMVNLPRRASFIASVNYEHILTDMTGTRRYLCFQVIDVDYEHNVDMDGVMAQAYALYKSGFQYWFDKEEIRELNLKNDDFRAKSIEEELIETWLRPVTQMEWINKSQLPDGEAFQVMTATQIATKLLEKARMALTDYTIMKIGKALANFGFVRTRKGNSKVYIVRLLSYDEVERNKKDLDDPTFKKPATSLDNPDKLIGPDSALNNPDKFIEPDSGKGNPNKFIEPDSGKGDINRDLDINEDDLLPF